MALNRTVLSAVLAGVFVCAPIAAAQDAPADVAVGTLSGLSPDLEDLWIIEMRLRGRQVVLSDVLAYGDGDGTNLFVPLLQLSEVLDFVFDYDAETQKITGWFLSENQTFELDTPSGQGRVAGRDITLPPGTAFEQDGDIYIPLVVASDWFALKANWDRTQQFVSLDPAYLLPNEVAAKRGKGRPGARGPALDIDGLIRQPDNYRWVSWPHSTNSVNFNRQSGSAQTRSFIQGSTILRGDLLKMNGELFGSFSNPGQGQLRLRLGRVDPGAELLGPMRASRFQMGDITLSAAPLLQRASSGVGFRIAREPLAATGRFDQTVLEGAALPGWQAELYRDGELLSFQTIGAEGRYLFDNVPLVFGNNRFRIALYGPQGQERTIEISRDIDTSLIRRGDFNYSFELLDAGNTLFLGRNDFGFNADNETENASRFELFNRGLRAQGVFGYGVSGNLSLRGIASWQEGLGEANDTTLGGLGLTWAGPAGPLSQVLINTDGLINQNGDIAGRVSLASAIRGVSILIDREDYSAGFETDANRVGNQSVIASRTGLRLDGRVPDMGLGWGVGVTEFMRRDGGRSRNANLRLSTSARGLSLAHNLSWQQLLTVRETGNISSNRLTGSGSLAGAIGPIRLRALFDYDVEPELRMRRAGFDATTRWQAWSVNARTQYDFRSDSFDLTGGLSRDFSGIRLGFDVRHNTGSGQTQGLLTANFALDRDPLSGGVRWGDEATSDRGAALVRVYEDLDASGHFSKADRVISASRIISEPRGRAESLEDGRVLVTALQAERLAGFAVDTSELEDPYAIAADRGHAVLTRPGVVARVDLPVVESAEAEFLVTDDDGEPAPNRIASLTACDGSQIYRERSAYDGLVFFQFIKPGCYRYSVKSDASGTEPIQIQLKAGELYSVF